MAISNRERVDSGLNLLRDGLIPFIERHLKNHFGNDWDITIDGRRRFPLDRNSDGNIRWDSQALLKVMWDVWNEVFREVLGHFERSLVSELMDVRNRHAHEEPFNSDDTYRALDSIQRLLQAISASKQAEEIGKMKIALQRTVYAEQSRNKTRYTVAVEGSPTASLKPWREVIVPHPDVASGQYQQAEFAADLSQVARGEATSEYQDAVEFYRRTFITAGIKDLLKDALLRLSGKGGEPVVELQTNFGGGKTHSMLALFHLFSEERSTALPGMEDILKELELDHAPAASRAVLVGTALSPGEVVTKHDGTEIRTLWGEMAWQLAGKDGYDMVADSDRNGISPGSEILSELFNAAAPCIILIDEWVAYARQTVGKHDLASGDFESQASFAQALTEAARAAENTLVVATLPASRIEIGGENGEFALESLKGVFKRLGKPWRPATAEEGFEIVRRRLFEPITDRDDFVARDAVVGAFSQMYQSSQNDFPNECKEGAYRRRLELAYPFHPELFDKLYGEWSTLDKFQRTRGVLRLLAKVIHRMWSSQDGSLLIMPATIPMDDNAVKSELTQFLEDVWEPIISADVDGPSSLPYKLDGENASTLGRYSACRRVARTLYVGTAPGSKGSNPGINDRAIRLGCVQPGEATATFGDALRRITDRAAHIHHDGNRYWISTKANLNRLADDRTNEHSRQVEGLYAEIVQRIRNDQTRGEFAAVHRCPIATNEVSDEPEARLVILGPEHAHRKGKVDTDAIKQAKLILETRGNSPRLLRNMVVFLTADKKTLDDLLQATAQYLAWKSINEEKEELNLDAYGRRQASANLSSSN
ncbi:MAG TPA: ATP-binding protein, partial [Bacteroidetes bacterium]|nr:ATP-binding protein [Bacteroidota bacterium]HEX04732.1 ATP-binding protein [Bacteroidota bacterium]